jgi:serine protease Do
MRAVQLGAIPVLALTLFTLPARTNAQSLQLDGGGYFGIQMEDVSATNKSAYKLKEERGVIVRSVEKGSPAEKAGLKENDVLLDFGSTPVWSAAQFSRLVSETPPDRKVEIAYSRDGKRMTGAVQIGKAENPLTWNRRIPNWSGPGDGLFQFRVPRPPDPQGGPNGRKPRLGVGLQTLNAQLATFFGIPGTQGVLVTSVVAGSPADGKLKKGDVIVECNKKKIEAAEDLIEIVDNDATGKLSLKILRDKKEAVLTIDLQPRPATDSDRGFHL